MFEIGDKVIYQGADKAAYRREGTVVSIEDKDGKPQLTVELDGGETFTAPIDDWSRKFNNACTSTNSVVRNAMAAHGVARNAMQDAGSYVRECNKFIPEANAMIREWDAFYKKMTAKRKWYDSTMTELRDGFYKIDKGDPDYDKARAAYDALRDVSRSAEAVHLFYSV